MTPAQQKMFHQADQLLDQGHYHEAARQFGKLYDQVDEFVINRQLVKALYEDQQYAEADAYASEHLNDYAQSKELMQQLLDVELANQCFIDVRIQLAALPKWHDEFINQVQEAEKRQITNYQATVRTQLQRFYHLGDVSFNEQQQRFKEALHLPLEQYLTGARFLLRDPFVNPLIRSSIMQILQKLRLTGKIKMYWLDDQEHEIDLATLPSVEKMPQVVQIEKRLGKDFAHDPTSYQMFMQEFRLELTFLYPLIDQAIPNADAWYQALTAYSQSSDHDKAVMRAKEWQEQIARLAQRLSS